MDPAEKPLPVDCGVETLHQLFEASSDRLLAFLRWRSTPGLAARRDPEDILQNAYLQAQKRWDEYGRSGMAFYPWFCRLVLNCLFDDHDYQSQRQRDYRAEQAWPDRSSVQLALGLENPGTTPSEAAGRRELHAQIDEVLGLLPPDHQEILVLIHFAELTREAAAQILGIAGNTARQRYARARVRFREVWKERFGDEELRR
jgi:RNA polymerase sigma-70 factor, ECF subfamily